MAILLIFCRPFPPYLRNVPISHHCFEENGTAVVLPYLKPSDVLKCLLTSYPWTLLGGLNPGAPSQNMLETFWLMYKQEHSSHQVYSMEKEGKLQFKTCIPLLLHGDGGRTLKKQPLEVISLFAPLGLDTEQEPFKCSCINCQEYSGQDLASPFAQRLNSQHSSYLSHFLLLAFPSKHYRETPGLLAGMLSVISEDLRQVCLEGIPFKGAVYHFGILGMKGDLEYHAKTGFLSRSYQNVGHRNPIPCCHECLAGSPMIPFEDFTTQAAWRRTVYQDPPWNEPPPFHRIPFDDWTAGSAARFFRRDPFHVFRLGIARNFIASSVLLMCFNGLFDSDSDSREIKERLKRAWASCALWMDTHGLRTAAIRSFTKEKFHFATNTSFPWVGCKGSDTIVLLKWLRWCSGLHALANPDMVELTLVQKACTYGLRFQCIHRHGIWLRKPCRQTVFTNAKGFHDTYARLAQLCHQRSLTLFSMVPKAHTMGHVP